MSAQWACRSKIDHSVIGLHWQCTRPQGHKGNHTVKVNGVVVKSWKRKP